MNVFNDVLFWINNIVIILFCLAFASQIVYVLLFFLKPKKYKESEVKHKIAVIIPARNEAEVLSPLLQSLLKQNYPKDKYDIFVVAHNCTDNTAEIARAHGVYVIEENNDNERKVGFALKRGINKITSEYGKYDFLMRYDADSLVHPDALSKMNDAYASGVKIAKGYNNTKNYNKSVVSGVCSLYYIRDNRFTCQVRSRISATQVLIGTQMMVSMDILEKIDGWDCFTAAEDAEFAVKRMLEGYKIDYVPDAIVYDEQPGTVADSFKRFSRVGHGLIRLFFKDCFKLLGKFFTTFKWRYLDMFLTQMFIPMALVACVWFPLYYGYTAIFFGVTGNMAALYDLLIQLGIVLGCYFYIPFVAQALLAYALDRKKVVQRKGWNVFLSIVCQPFFMIVYAIAIAYGIVVPNLKWKELKRTPADKELLDYLGIRDDFAKEAQKTAIDVRNLAGEALADRITKEEPVSEEEDK